MCRTILEKIGRSSLKAIPVSNRWLGSLVNWCSSACHTWKPMNTGCFGHACPSVPIHGAPRPARSRATIDSRIADIGATSNHELRVQRHLQNIEDPPQLGLVVIVRRKDQHLALPDLERPPGQQAHSAQTTEHSRLSTSNLHERMASIYKDSRTTCAKSARFIHTRRA